MSTEPEPILPPPPDHRDDTRPEKYKIVPEPSKVYWSLVGAIAYMLLFFVMYCAVSDISFGQQPSSATRLRVALAETMANFSADPCTEIFNYSCGTYIARLPSSSLFGETQSEIISIINSRSTVFADVDKILDEAAALEVNTSLLDDIGVFSCVSLEIAPCVFERNHLALYISVPCAQCHPMRHEHAPIEVETLPAGFPEAAAAVFTLAVSNDLHVVWFPPDAEDTDFAAWYERECGEVSSATELWNNITDRSAFSVATTLYNDAVEEAMPCAVAGTDVEVAALIETSRKLVESYLTVATWIATDAVRSAMVQRAATVPIHFGSGRTLIPSCSLDLSLYDCLRFRWRAQQVLMGTPPAGGVYWGISGVEVNAVYDPLQDAVFVPWAIARPPFYNPGFDLGLAVASLGAVIMHEVGHSLRPGWHNPVQLTLLDADATERFEMCITNDFREAGSNAERANMTINEDFADAIAFKSLARFFRRIGHSAFRQGITIYAQTWCFGSRPRHYPASYFDPHAAPFLRDTATVAGERAFYEVFGCPINAANIC